MNRAPNWKVSEREELAFGAEGKAIWPPEHVDNIPESLCQRDEGSFFLHFMIHDSEGELTGNIKKDISPEDALKWWLDHHVPPEI